MLARARPHACARSARGRAPGTSRRAVLVVRLPRASLRQESIIDVAPRPRLIRLDGRYDRMFRRVIVLGRVSVGRRVAAADVPARQTLAEVDPLAADLHALDTTRGRSAHV